MPDPAATLTEYATNHAGVLIPAGLAATVLFLLWVVRRAVKSGQPDRWLSILSVILGLAWTSEGMWEIAVGPLKLPIIFAIGTFFIFETQLGTSMIRAERYKKLHGHTGKHGRAVWTIASAMAIIVAAAGNTLVETILRLAIPLLVIYQWWDGLPDPITAVNLSKRVGARSGIVWAWPLRRVLVAAGLARPTAQATTDHDRDWQINKIARVAHRLHTVGKWRRHWYKTRLRRLAMTADDATLIEARRRVERVWAAQETTRPLTPAEASAVATAEAEAEAARTELAELRAAFTDQLATLRAEVSGLRFRMEAETTRRVPATSPPPVPETAGSNGHHKPRRTPEDTLAEYRKLAADRPGLTQVQYAQLLGTTDRTLRNLLNRQETPS